MLNDQATDRHTEDDIRYVRRRYLNTEAARRIAIEIANATFAARKPSIWAPEWRYMAGRAAAGVYLANGSSLCQVSMSREVPVSRSMTR
ncbi:hypothetical protein ACWEH3_35235 [Nocardia sp. NPDC004718]